MPKAELVKRYGLSKKILTQFETNEEFIVDITGIISWDVGFTPIKEGQYEITGCYNLKFDSKTQEVYGILTFADGLGLVINN